MHELSVCQSFIAQVELDIRPELYDLWLDALIATAREHDPDFDAAAEALWRECLRPGIEVMRSHY